jgi:hypothetical protein
MNLLHTYIDGVGLIGPGWSNWPQAQALLCSPAPEPATTIIPTLNCLAANERRRASSVVRLALTVGLEAVRQAEVSPLTLATVFASSGGDSANCHAICESLANDEPMISPTRFHNSVTNAPAGYWSIATQSMAASTVICAYESSFAAGLLEAMVQLRVSTQPCLLIAYDAPYPEPLHSTRPLADAFGVALLLSPERGPHSQASFTLERSHQLASRCQDPALECLRQGIPAARVLPLLSLLAQRMAGQVAIEYLAPESLLLEITPCS